jgi:hypothetical protein
VTAENGCVFGIFVQQGYDFFHEVLEMAAKRSCWWYGIKLDASDPEDSLAQQLCGINNIKLDTMFDACGFILIGKFKQDALTNFA